MTPCTAGNSAKGRGCATTGSGICGIIATLTHGMGALACVGYFLFVGALFTSLIGAAAKSQAQLQKAQADAGKASREAKAPQQLLQEDAVKTLQAAAEKKAPAVPASPPKLPKPAANPAPPTVAPKGENKPVTPKGENKAAGGQPPRPDLPDPPADPAEHIIAVRVYDRFDNVVTVKAVVR